MKSPQNGAYVQHFQYGLGVVMRSDSEYTDIDFDLHGMKKFLTATVVLEHPEGTPPRRRSSEEGSDERARDTRGPEMRQDHPSAVPGLPVKRNGPRV